MTSIDDPFAERPQKFHRRQHSLLGNPFRFTSDSVALLQLVDEAYGGLASQGASRLRQQFEIELASSPVGDLADRSEPPRAQTLGRGGFFCAHVNAGNFAVLDPKSRRGLVSISRDMLEHPYHARYELLEFAVFTLASRAQNLAPLHAACVAKNGRALLLVGESGAGKSTLALHCMLQGMQLVCEDAVFVAPRTLLAAGVPNYLHLRRDSLRFIDDARIVEHVRASPIIRRRSGVRKFEVNVRNRLYRTAREPTQLVGVIFVSPARARRHELLRPLDVYEARKRLVASQPYPASLRSWKSFSASLSRLATFELTRGAHPAETASALRTLLDWGSKRRRGAHGQAVAAEATSVR